MKKTVVLSVLLCVCMVFLLSSFETPAAVSSSSTIEQDRNDLKNAEKQLNTVKSKRQEIEDQIKDAQDKYENKYAEKLAYQSKMTYILEEIEATENLIAGYEKHITELTVECENQEAMLLEYYAIYDKILCYYYEYGDTSTLEMLLQSKNISDFLTRLDYLNYILEYNNTITDKIEETKESYELLLEEQKSAKDNLDNHVATLEITKTGYEADLETMDTLLAEYKNDQRLSESQMNQLKNDEAQLLSSISSYQSQIADKLKEQQEKEENEQNTNKSYGFPINSQYWSSNNVKITSVFAYRKNPVYGYTELHNGIDFAASYGTPIETVKAGIVTTSENRVTGFGEVVVISHWDGTSTLYGHCSKRLVKVGETVKQGDVIALVGSTGLSTGNHLHFSVLVNGEYKNPKDYLSSTYLKKLDIYNYLGLK